MTVPSWTKTSCPQPTAQYGQTDLTTRSAPPVRGRSSRERLDCAARPRPSESPRICLSTGHDDRSLEAFIGQVLCAIDDDPAPWSSERPAQHRSVC
jgi:hypothetical protein